MMRKFLTGVLLILLLTSILTAFNATTVFVSASNRTQIENTDSDLLRNVNFNGAPQDAANLTNNSFSDLLNYSQTDQTSTQSGSWGSNSTQIVVGLTDTFGAFAQVSQLALTEDGRVINKVSMGSRIAAAVVNVPGDSLASFVTEVKQDGLSTYVEPNTEYQAFMEPNDTYWNLQWGPKKIQANYAWNTTTGNKTVLVAIVDTGIDYDHPDLAANYVPLGYNWVSNNSNPLDDNGHGTHIAGIIGAVINNGIGIAGLAQVRIMAEKGLDAQGMGNESTLADAIIDATNKGANIISMSWGGSSPSTLIQDALIYAYDHGVLLVAAAGNSASSQKIYPAAYPEVIAVTATDQNDNLASFSSYGDWVELAAPGVNIFSTTPTYHVTLNAEGVTMNYSYMSGTSMACPEVSGVAALVLSEFPKMSRDVLRLRLRDTADDVGGPGFNIYYGYGRVNARKAVQQPLPTHDVAILGWETPPYVEPGKTGIINATIVDYGTSNETNVTVELLVNGSLVGQPNVFNMTSGGSTLANFTWTPTIKGNYNVTVYALPVAGETNLANNVIQGYVNVGVPLRVFVLRSAGTELTTDVWDTLNDNWMTYGKQLIQIDYTTLDKNNITFADLNATQADVLILSCAYAWQYTDSEIDAIKQYVYEGHGFIATAGSFYNEVPNNNKFLPLFGMNESTSFDATWASSLDLLNSSHPLFAGVPNPYTMPYDFTFQAYTQTSVPSDGVWSSQELAGGTYIAMGFYNESAIITYRGLVYISPWLESIPAQYKFNLQLLYNAITWSHYQKPQHQLTTTLQAPPYMFPNSTITINATVTNNGVQNESNVGFQLSIRDIIHNETILLLNQTIPSLLTGESNTTRYSWNPTVRGVYNITAYATPVSGESDLADNTATVLVDVAPPLIHPQEGTWANYRIAMNITGQAPQQGTLLLNYSKYVSQYLLNVTLTETIGEYPNNATQTAWTTVNTITRYCEGGVWQGLWFPGLIETNITSGASVNVLGESARVIGSEEVIFGARFSNCWKLFQNYVAGNYTWLYDKTNGLWVDMIENFSYGPGAVFDEIFSLNNTDIPTGQQLLHDLQVSLEAPSSIWLGNSTLLNATMLNRGALNETNVQLILIINGTQVKTLSIPELTTNTFNTTSYLWTPATGGMYNVTTFAPQVTGENITANNIMTAWVRVVAFKGRVLFDQAHGAYPLSIYSIWISNLQADGFIIDNNTGSINSSTLTGYNAFVTIGAYQNYTSSEIAAIKTFVADGGGLLVIGGLYPDVFTNLTSFANISWTFGGVGSFTNDVYPHAVTQGVYVVFLSSPATELTLSGRAQWLVNDTFSNVMLAVNWYHQGRVMAFTDEGSLRDSMIDLNGTDNLRLATNMIAWLCEKDTTPPEISSITPANGTVIGTNSVELRWNATDLQSGIDHYSVYVNGQWVTNTTAQSYYISGLLDGSNNVTLLAYDVAGNQANKSVMIIVDTTPPTVQILNPANNSYVRQAVPINVQGFDTHFSHMDLSIDSHIVASFNTSGEQTYVWNTSSDQFGSHKITLTGYDVVGNSANVSVIVTVDNVSPTVRILSPTNGTYVHGSITIAFIVLDKALENASVNIGASHTYNVTGTNSTVFNTTLLADGTYNVTLIAYDFAGNTAQSLITLTIDNTAPTALITFPINGTYLKGIATINFTFADADLESATLSLGGQVIDVTGNNHYLWDTTAVSDGNYVLTLTVVDKAGNTKTDAVAVIVDNTVPIGEIRLPANFTYVRGDVNITIYSYDVNLLNTYLSIDGGSALQIWNTSGTHSYLWNTTTATDGLHTISLSVYDKAGNQFTTSTEVNVYNAKPTVSITSPQNSSTVSGNVSIDYTASDPIPFNLTLFIDNAKIIVYPHQTYQWDTTKVINGNHTISIVAVDIAGNVNEETLTLITANAAPAYLTLIGYSSAAALGLTLGALAVWAVLRKKSASPPKPAA